MSRAQRDKGRRFERECAALINDSVPGADASLIYGQEEIGGQRGDIESTLGNFECKRRAQLAKDMCPQPDVRGVFARSDRGETLVVIRARDFLGLVRMERESPLLDSAKEIAPAASNGQGR